MNMSQNLEAIRNQVGKENLIDGNSFTRERCRVDLAGLPLDRVVVDIDKVYPSGQEEQRQCDCVLFYFAPATAFVTVPMELKSGRVDVSAASEQLKRGAVFAARFVPRNAETICLPVLFHGRGIRAPELKELSSKRSRIRFGGKTTDIRVMRCGNKLADMLKQAKVLPISDK